MIKNTHFILLIFGLFVASCSIYKGYFKVAKSINFEIDGQTAPPDMIFIKGNDEMESFYMSATEEPNINYLIYLKWLNAVYSESYPEVLLEAMPKQLNKGKFLTYNDPYLHSYLTHPAFAYYPVTGLTWEQIQNYLAWKTDRLNETILIKNGILEFNTNQQDEDNFNTEAYLLKQYEGYVSKPIYDAAFDTIFPHGERSAIFSDGILFTGFRLPTETEWEYANASQYRSPNAMTYAGKKHPHHPYGNNYYTLAWSKAFDYRKSYDYYARDNNNMIFDAYPVNAKDYEGSNYELPDAIKLDKTKQRMGNIPADYGLINMEGGAKEWLIDSYEENYQPEPDWKVVYRKSGYDVDLEVGLRMSKEDVLMYPNYHPYSYHVEKDSLGRMRSFRYMDADENGQPLEVGKTLNKYYYEWKSKFYAYQAKYNYTFHYGKPTEKKQQEAYDEIIRLGRKAKQYDVHRVVKGGTWQESNSNRAAMPQDSAAIDVGFRCILPYTGLPVRKGYKVKW